MPGGNRTLRSMQEGASACVRGCAREIYTPEKNANNPQRTYTGPLSFGHNFIGVYIVWRFGRAKTLCGAPALHPGCVLHLCLQGRLGHSRPKKGLTRVAYPSTLSLDGRACVSVCDIIPASKEPQSATATGTYGQKQSHLYTHAHTHSEPLLDRHPPSVRKRSPKVVCHLSPASTLA